MPSDSHGKVFKELECLLAQDGMQSRCAEWWDIFHLGGDEINIVIKLKNYNRMVARAKGMVSLCCWEVF